MTEINSFPINTLTYEELDPITDAQATDSDGVLFFDESVGVMKRMTRGELFKGKVIPINSIADLPSLDVSGFDNRQQFHLNSFAPDGSSGGGPLMWAPDKPKSLHDGIRYFSPTVPIPADFDNPTDVQNYMDGVGEEFPTADGIFELTLYSIESSEFPSIDGAFVLWDGVSGTRLKNGVVPSLIGIQALQIPNIASVSYARFNDDETISMRTLVEHKTDLQLNNVDNTSDADKPTSIATQTELDLKAPLASPSLTGTPTAPTAAANTNTEQLATTAFVQGELTDRVQSVATIADLRGLSGVSVGQIFIVNGVGTFEAIPGSYSDDGQLFIQTANGVICTALDIKAQSDIAVNIPSDFPDPQSAIDYISSRVRISGYRVTINLEAGYSLTRGILIDGWNAGYFIITSDDPIVSLSAGFVPAIIDPSITGLGSNNAIIAAQFGGTTPVLKCLLDAGLQMGSGIGLAVLNGSKAVVSSGGYGIINAEFYGFLVVNNSGIDAGGSNFSQSNWGCRVTTGSNGDIRQSNLNGCREATYGGSGTTAGLDVSRGSVVNFKGPGGTVADCAARGIAVRRSRVSAEQVDASRAGMEGVRAENASNVSFALGYADDCGGTAVAANSSIVDCRDASLTNAGGHGVMADDASTVNARGVNVTGYTNRGIYSVSSHVNARSALAQKDGVSDTTTDLSVGNGGTLAAISATGGVNQAANTVTLNGIIFK